MNKKAWMDRVGLMSYYSLIVYPWRVRMGFAKVGALSDSCSSHKSPQVIAHAKSLGIEPFFIIPRCTELLQIIDLVYNGPYKAKARKARVDPVYRAFQDYTMTLARASMMGHPAPPPFVMPHRKPIDGILQGQEFVEEKQKDAAFTAAVAREWVKKGFFKNVNGGFDPYVFS